MIAQLLGVVNEIVNYKLDTLHGSIVNKLSCTDIFFVVS